MGRPPKNYHWTTISQKYDDFEISESDWKAIQKASNYALNKSTRDQILNATRHFLMMAEGERNAPKMYPQSGKAPKQNAAEARLQRIKDSAKKLEDILREKGPAVAPEFEADNLIMMNCEGLPELGGPAVRRSALERRYATRSLADLLGRFLATCNKAERELKLLKNAPPIKDGDAWNEWIASINKLLAKPGCPTSASLIHSKQGHKLLPPFVRLIRALQKRVPQEFVRKRSAEALAKAVERALHRQRQDS